MKNILAIISLLIGSFGIAQAQHDALLKIMVDELDRETEEFRKTDTPPYFIAYRITDSQSAFINSSFGSLTQSSSNRNRLLMTTVRVGDYSFDNTRTADKRDLGFMRGMSGPLPIPIEDHPDPISYTLWRSTQSQYKQALESYKLVRSSSSGKSETSSASHDFSREESAEFIDKTLPPFDSFFRKAEWEEKVKQYSQPFLNNPDLVSGDVTLRVVYDRKYFVSSEGSRVVQNAVALYLYISGSIRANDGDIVPLYQSYFAFRPEELPTDEIILEDVKKLIEKLEQLKKAPLAEPYSGPAILHSQTAGVFFHEIFGHRVEGHRLKNEYDGQTFKAKVKEQVLPKTMSVIFDPTLKVMDGVSLNGHYTFDDEGVRADRVLVVDKGILKTFLMSRSPLESLARSNGHGRAAEGAEPVSRQSNLIVETSKAYSDNDLRKMLIKECKKQGKLYGYLFRNVTGGFTQTDRYNPNAFNIFPTEVYRVYVDGRPDELVRGVDLIGTPLAMFAEIAAAGNKREVFTGFCGAESGNVPVSAVAPSLFVRRIETQKKPKAQLESTLLSRPMSND